MSRRTSKVRAASTSSTSKSAARSKSSKKPRRKGHKDTKSSDTGEHAEKNEESPSPKPSLTTVQSTLPSLTPIHVDEGSLQPCVTQHGTTEIEEITVPIVHTDFTQDTEKSERTPLIPVTAHAFTETTEGSPIPKGDNEQRSGKKKGRRKNTQSSRAFFPPHLIGAGMSQRRVKRVKASVDEKRVPLSSEGSGSINQQKSVKPARSGRSSRSKRSMSKRKKERSKRKRRKTDNSADRDERFFRRVEKFKNRKVEMDCTCPITKCEGCDRAVRRVGGCLKTTGRACWVICLPPLPNIILNKAAFWPPPREYYFFQEKTVEGQKEKIMKLRKATKDSLNQPWRFGFEHNCYKPLSTRYIECFTIETRKKHYLACVMVHTPTKHPKFTLLYSHPNGSDLSDHMNGVPSVAEIARFLDCDIVIFDYSGYGISSGQSNEKSLFADIEGVYQHLVTVRKIEPAKIVIYGYSIGTAAAVAFLAEVQPQVAGAILLAPLTSMLRVLVWKRACFNTPFARRRPCIDKFRTIEKIPLVTVPILICHGKDDIVVPIDHGQAVYDKAPVKVPPLWISDAGHNNLENTKELWARIRHFINNELPSSRSAVPSSQTSTPLLVTPLGGTGEAKATVVI